MSSVYFLIDKTLGKYKVLEHIGHGGMSEVYKGEQAQLSRMVAIKVLHPFLADEEGFVVRFQREARIVATMRHPNIVQVYDFDYNEELAIYYMVMEYIDGPTLKDLLGEGPMSAVEVARIGAAIADALDYAHQRSMVHRDIKPANIMFIDDKEPVLTDFGIAKMLTLSGLTASGAMVGTPAYMAPEVGTGKAGTAYSDLYSLGVVLYEALTGTLPFDAETPMGMVMQHINDQPPPPSRFAPSVPEPLEKVILRAMTKQPEERFKNGAEMARELRRAAGLESAPKAPLVEPEISEPVDIDADETPTYGDHHQGVVEDEYQERLVRSWPATEVEEEPQTSEPETVGPVAAVDSDTSPPQAKRAQRRQPHVLWRIARLLVVLTVLIALGSGIWFAVEGSAPPLIQNLLYVRPADAVPSTTIALQSAEPSPTPTIVASSTPTPTPEPTPSPTPSPTVQTVCAPRVRLDSVFLEPDRTVAPGTPLLAYITLRNNGACLWPAGSAVYFAQGEQLGEPDSHPINALQPGEIVQIVVPLQAPEEIGTYNARWEVRRENGKTVGSSLPVEIVVSDIPAATPTPAATVSAQTIDPAPLMLEAPTILEWEDRPETNQWWGVIVLEAEGGIGRYRYYQTEVSERTRIEDGKLPFEWRRCEALPLSVWVLSGEEVVNWRGEVPYPDSTRCE